MGQTSPCWLGLAISRSLHPMNWDEREVELKFAVNAALAERIFVQLNSARTAPRRLESTYFDTADQALRKAGFTARVRKDGSRWTQTVKSRMAVDGVGRGEWEAPAKGCVLDADFVRTTPAATALGGSSLEPLFSVCVQRRSVALNEPGCAIEASFDKGSAKRSGRFAVFSELELELKSGAPTAFFELARRWRNAFALRPGFTTKADRGFALISGEGRGPRPFEAPRIHPDMTAGAAFKAIAMAALEQIAGN